VTERKNNFKRKKGYKIFCIFITQSYHL